MRTVSQKKHQLAIKILERTFSHGIPPQWMLADALYGSTYELRKYLLDKKQAYVVAVSRQQHISMNFQQILLDAAIKNFSCCNEVGVFLTKQRPAFHNAGLQRGWNHL